MINRNLHKKEIDQLKSQHCAAEDWDKIHVDANFNAEHIVNVRFAGQIKIAANVRLRNIGLVQNYEIQEGACIENVASVSVEGTTTFGNGTEINILNEGGGRELPIYDLLTSQVAYLLVNYRYDTSLIAALKEMIHRYVDSKQSRMGIIGAGVRICNCGTIKNVAIGPHALLENACCLAEGTIVSNKHAHVTIGEGVIARHFIVLSGSKMNEGALLSHCFVGQAVSMGKQFSGENSAFFANCEAFHSEACSIFAGPYTVTHHKSTLLIAAMFSFYNAGSATNQSNHMYKLGPLHQGVLERGAKTGSFSYLLWPSHVSAYSVVIGKHYINFDIAEFPFSYLAEEDGKSVLTPAMNLFTVGTRRDIDKWPQRDKRRDSLKLDLIHFDLFNPYIIGRILTGVQKLKELYEGTARDKEYVLYKGVYIKRLMLRQAIKYYEMAIKIYIGDELSRQIEAFPDLSFEEWQRQVQPERVSGSEWYDLAGMFISSASRQELLQAVRGHDIKDIDKLNEKLRTIFRNYERESWQWCVALIESRQNKVFSDLSKDDLSSMIDDWKVNSLKLNNMILNDAGKEFDAASIIGYGLDGLREDAIKDFAAVRGNFMSNSFVMNLQKESEAIALKAEKILLRFGKGG